jgi:predicted nucleic acid-binding protein
MRVEAFLDTSVLVYAAAGRDGEEGKRRRALELIESGEFGISAQVMQEFYVTVTRKTRVPLTAIQALDWIDQWLAFPCHPLDDQLVRIAISHSERFRISCWDAAILSAAEALGAEVVYSEDLNAGQLYGAVRVVNPFRSA